MSYSEVESRVHMLEQARMSVLNIIDSTLARAEKLYPAHAHGLDVIPSEEMSEQQYDWEQVQKLEHLREVIQTSKDRKLWREAVLPLAEELFGGQHPLSRISETVRGDKYELGNALIRFCNAAEPFASQEHMWNRIVLDTILPLLGAALNKLDSVSSADIIYPPDMERGEDLAREQEFLQQQIDFLIRQDTEPHARITMVRWIQTAYTEGLGYTWIDPHTRAKIDELITQIDTAVI